MIVLFTDFGIQDPYVGQVKSVLLQQSPGIPVIDLLHHVPDYNIRAAAYLLPAYVNEFPRNSIFVCVVDPGVGGARIPCAVQIDHRWFVGPENGLFTVLQQRSTQSNWWKISVPDEDIPMTFHGRDIFAPAAARLALGDMSGLQEIDAPPVVGDWPEELAEIIYIDHYGNLVSGYRFRKLPQQVSISLNGIKVPYASTFSAVAAGEAFYYANSNGLLEIAVNQGNASKKFRAQMGDALLIGSSGTSVDDG
jgi:S-adenosylmethionine hydrolase